MVRRKRGANAVRLLFTCEHGGNDIPGRYAALFRTRRKLLESHRGYDPGALTLAREFAKTFEAKLFYSTTSRLLVELNRSPRHRDVLSDLTRALPPSERTRIMQAYYWPYRSAVETHVAAIISKGARIVHISCHSFTPALRGVRRRADIGLLYDPGRRAEADFCRAWQEHIRQANGALVVRRNYPYRGSGDGLTTHLRTRHAGSSYIGIEIEVNQRHARGNPRAWRRLRALLIGTFAHALEERRRSGTG